MLSHAKRSHSALYNSLPTLLEARNHFSDKGGLALILEVFEPLFREYGIETLGVGLLHHHFNIYEGEQVVEFNNVSTPWPIKSIRPDGISPMAWAIEDGILVPYEFTFSPPGAAEPSREVPVSFTERFINLVRQHELENVLALRSVGSDPAIDGSLEETYGRVNVTFKSHQVTSYPVSSNR